MAGALLCATRVLAQIWTGANGTTWSDPLNWSGGVPGAAATATFNSSTVNAPNLTGTATVGQLLFSSGSDAETFTGLALTLNGVSSVGLDNQSGVTQTFNNTLIVGAVQTWTAGSGDLSLGAVTLNNTLTLTGSSALDITGTLLLNGANRTVTNNSSGSVTFSGGVTGATRTLTVDGTGDTSITGAITTTTGGLIKLGTGTLSVSGANTNTGATTIGSLNGASGGTLRLNASDILANATTTVFAGTLDLNGFNETIGALTLGGAAATTTAAVTTGTGLLTLGGNLTYTSTNNPNGATISGNLGLGGANRTFTIGNSTATTDDLTISAVLSGSNAVTKAGTGTLVLSGANTYTGLTSVTAGVLDVRDSSALGTTAAGTSVSSGAALQLQGGIAIGAEALSITGSGISATGAMRNISGNNSWAGLITLTNTTNQFTSDAGTLTLSGGITAANRSLTITGAGDTTLSGNLTIGSGSLVKTGTGLLTLSGLANTYTGATTIGSSNGTSGGTLRLGNANVLSGGTTTVFAGTLDLNGHNDSIGALTLGGGASGTTAAVTTGAGTLTLGGNLTYTSTNNPNGATITGTLDLGGANRTFTIGNSTAATDDLTVSANITATNRTLTITGAGNTAITGAIATGTGGLIKTGTGTLTLSGANTYTGATTVGSLNGTSGGTLRLGNANVLSSATTTVFAGTLDLNGFNDTIGALTLGGGAAATTASVTTGTGLLTLGGNVTYTATNNPNGATISGLLDLGGINRTFTIGNSTAATDDLTISAILSGSNAVTKAGTGTLVLSGANTYTGLTSVTAGVLDVRNSAALGTTAAGTTVTNGAALQLQGGIAIGAEALSLNGTGVSTTGALRNLSGNNSWAGLITLATSSRINSDAGTLTLSGGISAANQTLTVAGAGDTAITTGLNLGTGGLLKLGTGTLTFSGVNTYTGATTIGSANGTSGGTLRLGNANVLSGGTTTVFAGTLDLNGYNDTIGALTLGGGASGTTAAVTTGAGILTLGGNLTYTATNNPNGATISGFLDLGGANRTFTIGNSTAATDDLTVSANITATNRTLTITGAGNTAITGAIATGTGGLIKTSTGTLTLSGANTYTGATTIGSSNGTSGGTLRLAASNVLSGGTTTVFAGTLDLDGYNDTIGALTLGGGAAGTSASVTTGTGLLTLGGNVTYTATNNPNGATISGNLGLGGANRTFTIGNSTATTDDLTISAILSGSNAVTKAGTGTLVLSGTNTYTGLTSVTAGVLDVRNSAALGTTAAGTTVTNGAALQLQGGIAIGAEALSITGSGISATGALRNISGNNSYAGLITLTAATNQFTSDAGTLTLSGGITGTNRTLTLTGAGNFAINSLTTGTGDLNQNGSGTTTLTGASTYTGATNVNAGTLQLGGSGVLSDNTAVTVASGATLDVNDQTETIGTLAGAGTVDLGSGALTTAGNGSTTFAGIMMGTGSFTKAGSGVLTLSGANSYTGFTIIDAGTLLLGTSGTVADSSAITVSSGATFDVNDQTETIATLAGAGTVDLGSGALITAGDGSTTFSGALAGTGSFTKAGTGVLTLDNDLTFNGTFNLAGGTLRLSDIALTLDTFNITGTSVIDFAGVSTLSVTNFNISGGVTLTIQNWADASDHFFTQFWTGATMDTTGGAPMNQITFDGFAAADTKWQSYDSQVTPVPEPSTYGALLLAATGGLLAWRRRFSRRGA